MTFNPAESIDFNGNTGPFIQYTYARIRSVLRKGEEMGLKYDNEILSDLKIAEKEIGLVKLLRSSLILSRSCSRIQPCTGG